MKSGTELLMIPGPTTLPGEVLRALARPAIDIYHGPLHDVSVDCLEGLRELFGTREKTSGQAKVSMKGFLKEFFMEHDWTGKHAGQQLKLRAFAVALAAAICSVAVYMLI